MTIALRKSKIRRDVAELMVAQGFRQSPKHPERFGRDPKGYQHKAFAVWLPEDEEHGRARPRGQRRYLNGSVVVRMSFALRVDDANGSQDDAYDAVEDAVQALIEATPRPYHLIPQRRSFRLSGDHIFADARFSFRFLHTEA